MIDLHQKLIDSQRLEYLLHDGQDFSIRDHGIVLSCDIKVTLIKLSEPALVDSRLIPSIYLADVEPLDLLDVGVVGHKSSEGHS